MLGIDVGSQSIKVVHGLKRGVVDNVQTVTYDETLSMENPEQVEPYLARLVKENRFGETPVWASLSSTHIKMFIADFPHMTDEELKSAVELQAEDYAPEDSGELDVDYQHIEQLPDQKVRTLVVVCPRNLTDKYVTLFRNCSLYPVGISVDALSAASSFQNALPAKQRSARWALLVDIGVSKSTIDIIDGDSLSVVRRVALGTSSLQEALDEEARGEQGASEEAGTALVSATMPLLTELQRTVEYYQRILRQRGNTEDTEDYQLYVCGRGSLISQITGVLGAQLRLNVDVFDPFENVKVGCELPDDAESRSIYASAVGSFLSGYTYG